jgi:hypothetical protein
VGGQRRGDPADQAFAYRFLSFELGLVKPDAAVFEAVAAEGAGFAACHVRGITAAREALVSASVLGS